MKRPHGDDDYNDNYDQPKRRRGGGGGGGDGKCDLRFLLASKVCMSNLTIQVEGIVILEVVMRRI